MNSGIYPWEQLIQLASGYYRCPVSLDHMQPIHQGASGRSIARIKIGDTQCIGIYWTHDRADNRAFLPVAGYLRENNIKVPSILAGHENVQFGVALVEDLGDANLMGLKNKKWKEKSYYYRLALEQLRLIHTLNIPSRLSLQPEFDEKLYQWEQEYFAEHYLEPFLNLKAKTFLSHPYCQKLSKTLASHPRVPIHRDFQSQNIHIFNNTSWIIDFQGLRLGLPEYDLASIIHDPYAQLSDDEKNETLNIWEDITRAPINHKLLNMCAEQRLMQALGAYGRLVKTGNNWYLPHIKTAFDTLLKISGNSPLADVIKKI